MKVIWTPQALQDREAIWLTIVQNKPQAASKLDEAFSEAAVKLAVHPMFGRVGLLHATRELIVHQNYRLVYEIDHEEVWILALVHAGQSWP
ncbi:type II toxin-antitoxin system RelE/ParE family toxin [Massilia sp. W12]|uniref:type II toxin-antitoxin system RelE/ParE family toxin n=1 Tax=Massilia sp. W12 TaxID=3126507 RepID=UPI0030D60D01